MVTHPGRTQPDPGPDGTRLELLTHAMLASHPGMLSDSTMNAAGFLIPANLLAVIPASPKQTSVQPRKPSSMLFWKLKDAEVNPKVNEISSSPRHTITSHNETSRPHDKQGWMAFHSAL